MATVWLLLWADLRQRWRALLGLALILGLVGGVVITAAAGARRTETAYPRLLGWANAAQATIIVTDADGTGAPPARQPADQYFVAGGRAAEAIRQQYFAALGRLPEVASLTLATEYNMALPTADPAAPDTGLQAFASPDGSRGVTGDRVKITAGRMFGAEATGDAVIDQALASRLGLKPGGTLRLIGLRKDAAGLASLKLAVPLTFRVSGIGMFDDQVVPTTATSAQPHVLLSPSFAATALAVTLTNLPEAAVRLRPDASMTSFLRDANTLRARYRINPQNYVAVTMAEQTAATERAIRPQALALGLFAALAGVIGLAVIGQLLTRQLALDAGDYSVLRAIGVTRGRLTAESLARLLAVTVAGGVIAVVIAVAASPLMPIGPARLAEPTPGLSVDLLVLGTGFTAVALFPVLVLGPAAWRAARSPARANGAGVLAGARPGSAPAAAQPSRLAAGLGHVGWVTSAVGMRMAFEPGRGRTAVPVRTALAATGLGSGAVVATSLLNGETSDTGCTGKQTCYNFLLLRLRPGANADAIAATLLAVGTLAHVLLTTVRRRRRDLAVLKTLGLTRRQVQAVVAWNATALAATALLIGVPLGIVAGRWAWAIFAGAAGVAPSPAVNVPFILLIIPATVALANLIAALPGRQAARLRPGGVLRTE